MANKDLLRLPHSIGKREDAWWYETSRGVEVFVQYTTPEGEWIATKKIVLGWKALRAALARKDKQ